jgi:hypothetical protein
MIRSGSETPSITVVVPVFGVSRERVVECARSIDSAIGAMDELFLVFDGPQPYAVENLSLPARANTLMNAHRLGLVDNWNRCLSLGSGDAVHLMHADDQIGQEFYSAVRGAIRRWPKCAFVLAGGDNGPLLLEADPAARLLLGRFRPPVGSVVYVRTGSSQTSFSTAYPYCPDEELLPRLALGGGVALIPRRLYRETKWEGQARFSTWQQPDFVEVYWRARIDSVRGYPPSMREVALIGSRSAVVSVCAYLIRSGKTDVARTHLQALRRLDPRAMRSPRVLAVTALAASRMGRVVLQVVDMVRGYRG